LGAGPLYPGARYDAGERPSSVTIGDLDGDPVPDLALANVCSDNVSVLRGARRRDVAITCCTIWSYVD
jgi:hypothetical protein